MKINLEVNLTIDIDPGDIHCGGTPARIEINGRSWDKDREMMSTLKTSFEITLEDIGSFGLAGCKPDETSAPSDRPVLATISRLMLKAGSIYKAEAQDILDSSRFGSDLFMNTEPLALSGKIMTDRREKLDLYYLACDNSPKYAINFDPTQRFRFLLIQANGDITGYDLNGFVINTTSFLDELRRDLFFIAQKGNILVFDFAPHAIVKFS